MVKKQKEKGEGVKVSRRFSYRFDKTRGAYFFLDVFNVKIHDSSWKMSFSTARNVVRESFIKSSCCLYPPLFHFRFFPFLFYERPIYIFYKHNGKRGKISSSILIKSPSREFGGTRSHDVMKCCNGTDARFHLRRTRYELILTCNLLSFFFFFLQR